MAEVSPLDVVTAAAGAIYGDDAGWQLPLSFNDMPDEYHRARQGAALFDRSHHGKVVVSGPDAASFLHNLCTNDVKALAPGSGCEAFLTNLKAKVIAHVAIYRQDQDSFWLDSGPGSGERVLGHLDRHLISEQVELADRTRELAQIHVAGPRALEVLEKGLGTSVAGLGESISLVLSPGDLRPPLARSASRNSAGRGLPVKSSAPQRISSASASGPGPTRRRRSARSR